MMEQRRYACSPDVPDDNRPNAPHGFVPAAGGIVMKKLFPWLCLMLSVAPLRAAEVTAGAAVTAARTIVLVRHGDYVPDAKVDRKLGPHLAPIGVAQARLTGARLAALPTRFDAGRTARARGWLPVSK